MKFNPPVHWKTWRMHHGYLGILMMIYGVTGINDITTEPIATIIMLTGFLIFVDDLIEHTITADTPLRILYDKVIYPLLKK